MSPETESLIGRAATALKAGGAREVYLFGSWAEGTAREGSDIDMAVAGLKPELFYDAMAAATWAIHKAIDLVDLDEDCPFIQYLKKKGKLVRVA